VNETHLCKTSKLYTSLTMCTRQALSEVLAELVLCVQESANQDADEAGQRLDTESYQLTRLKGEGYQKRRKANGVAREEGWR